jgi:DNA ligase-1
MYLNMDKIFDKLFAKSSTGKIKIWWVEVLKKNDKTYLVTYSGYENGKITSSQKEVHSKNKGRSNETTPYDQACNEAQSKTNKKMDEGYVLDKAELDGQVLLLPMLAHPYQKRKHSIEWPALVSPKLDGHRLLSRRNMSANIENISRKGKVFTTLSHLTSDIEKLVDYLKVSDGELYKHGVPLQDIAAASKKERDLTSQLEYWIFDCINNDIFSDRWIIIQNFFNEHSTTKNEFGFRTVGQLVEVPNYEVSREEELQEYHNKFVDMGFEGTMIRNKTGLYKRAHRSVDLLKKKDFLECEFKIIGGKEATGNDAGTVVFICKTDNGKSFDVRPKGTREQRRKWLNNLDNIVGKQLTVRFQYYSKDKIPCHSRGICIRDYE